MELLIERLQSPEIHAAVLVLGIVIAMLWLGKRIRAQRDDDE